MMRVRGLRCGYGAADVLHGVDIDVEAGAITTVIGANGAGKTTLLMSLCGRPRPRSGEIVFDGEDIAPRPMRERVKRGIAIVPEGRRIFPRMTVAENLQMGAFASPPAAFAASRDFVLSCFPLLESRLSQFGGMLSGGEQQMLAIARALMSRPRLLMLDEPSLGLAPLMLRQVFEILSKLNRERKLTILLVEQNAFQALKLADRAYVLANGAVVRQGTGLDVLADPAVQSAYLGGPGTIGGAEP